MIKILVNSTPVSYFMLGAYMDTGLLKYLYFLIFLLLYVFIIFANVQLIGIISLNRSLHGPMYLFLCSLLVNELYGSACLFPLLLNELLSDIHNIPASLCLLQVFGLYSYGGIEFFTLAMMSYDRYLAICHPLEYSIRMTFSKTVGLIVLSWLYPIFNNIFIVFYLTASLQLCGNLINKVYCDNYYIVRLACSDATVNNVFGLTHMFTVIFSLFLLIIYTYVRILKVCLRSSKRARQKALSTCGPHLASLMNYSCGVFFEIVQSRFNLTYLPHVMRIFLSLYFLTFPPVINPLLYGLQLSKIRIVYKTLLFGREK